MQAAFQKHVHASISKTINLPNTATKEDCEDALLMAWKLKLKGITMYRTGSRKNVVLSLKDPVSGSDEKNPENACTAELGIPDVLSSIFSRGWSPSIFSVPATPSALHRLSVPLASVQLRTVALSVA